MPNGSADQFPWRCPFKGKSGKVKTTAGGEEEFNILNLDNFGAGSGRQWRGCWLVLAGGGEGEGEGGYNKGVNAKAKGKKGWNTEQINSR